MLSYSKHRALNNKNAIKQIQKKTQKKEDHLYWWISPKSHIFISDKKRKNKYLYQIIPVIRIRMVRFLTFDHGNLFFRFKELTYHMQ